MTDKWFVAVEGKQYGPYSPDDLRGMTQSGRLQPDDLVWREGMREWEPARRALPELMPAAASRPRRQRAWDDEAAGAPLGPRSEWPGRVATPSLFLLLMLLFFLPWVDIRCTEAGRPGFGITVASQSGLQLCYGGLSRFEQHMGVGPMLNQPNPPLRLVDEQRNVKPAPLILVYGILIVGGVIVGLGVPAGWLRSILVGGCSLAAFAVLLVQLMIGFPVEDNIRRANVGGLRDPQPINQGVRLPGGPPMAVGREHLEVGTTPWFWIALLLTLGPIGMLVLDHKVIFARQELRPAEE